MSLESGRQGIENRLVGGARNYFARLLLVLFVAFWNLALLAGLARTIEALAGLGVSHGVETLLRFVAIAIYLVGAISALFLATRPAQTAKLSLQVRRGIPLLRLAAIRWLKRAGVQVNSALISILGTIAGALFLWRSSAGPPPTAGEFRTFLLAAGAMLGTILALLLSLAIIPVQRAMETFTPAIGKLYRSDPPSQLVIVTLAVFVLFSFSLSLVDVALSLSLLAFLQLTVIAVSLDLVRWYFRRVTQLLDPREAVSRLKLPAIRYINRLQAEVSVTALAQWRGLPSAEREKYSPAQIESHVYSILPQHTANIHTATDDLAEIAHRAVARDETQTVEFAVEALAEIASAYIETRKNNLRVFASTEALLASETDLDPVLNAVYEHLIHISRDAVAKGKEVVSISVIRALKRIGVVAISLSSPDIPGRTMPLGFPPIYYMGQAVSVAQRHEQHDVALQGSRALVDIARSAPDNVEVGVYFHAAKFWYEIALQFLLANKPELVNKAVEDMLTLAEHLLERRHYQLNLVLRELLRKIEALALPAVSLERALGSRGLNTPLSAAYDLTKPQSLGFLMARAASRVAGEEEIWLNPYSEYIEINKVVTDHLNTLGEEVDFSGSFLLWHITRTIRYIAHLYLHLATHPVTSDTRHVADLVGQVPRYMAFFWRAFLTVRRADRSGTDDACNALAAIGMEFYNVEFKNVTEAAASNIASIIQSYSKVAGTKIDWYEVADLLTYLWHIRLLAQSRSDADFLTIVDRQIDRAKGLPDDLWVKVLETLELRKKQLLERLHEKSYAAPPDDATEVLKGLLSMKA